MSKKRNHICDVKGCGHHRQRWQRLCGRCFTALPAYMRTGLIQAWRSGDRTLHRDWCRRAGVFVIDPSLTPENEAIAHQIVERTRGTRNPVTAAQAAAMTARMLGERPDA